MGRGRCETSSRLVVTLRRGDVCAEAIGTEQVARSGLPLLRKKWLCKLKKSGYMIVSHRYPKADLRSYDIAFPPLVLKLNVW